VQLGAFSISLAVKDIEASRKFYEMFGFTAFGGRRVSGSFRTMRGSFISARL